MVQLSDQLSNGFKRSVYWYNYQTISAKVIDNNTDIYELLSALFQGVKRLFVLATNDNESGIKNKNFLPRAKLQNLMEEIL